MPDADEHRRLGKIQTDKAGRLPAGTTRESHLEQARDHESSAHSNDWRDSGLRPPK